MEKRRCIMVITRYYDCTDEEIKDYAKKVGIWEKFGKDFLEGKPVTYATQDPAQGSAVTCWQVMEDQHVQ